MDKVEAEITKHLISAEIETVEGIIQWARECNVSDDSPFMRGMFGYRSRLEKDLVDAAEKE